jgi:hypothetical protein
MTSLVLAVALASLPAQEVVAETLVEVADDGSRLALRDVDGDRRLDLLFLRADGVGVRLQQADGTYPDADGARLAWPGEQLAWDLVDLRGDGVTELVLLLGSGEVRAYGLTADGRFDAGRELLVTTSYLPRGIHPMRFVRDVDGDGRRDLVLPGAGRYEIRLQTSDGGFALPMRIAYEADIDHDVGDPGRLDARFGQELRVPWFEVRDVDGDGALDIVSRVDDRVDFHLASPQLVATPTWSLDLASLRAPSRARDGFDLDDLMSNIDLGVRYEFAELDGKAPRDLVIGAGGTIKVYLGGSRRGAEGRPDQVLKLSGNLLAFLIRDSQGDASPDLQLVRGERISLGKVLRWLILPGSLDFEFFTYRNEGGSFSRKPTKRVTVALQIPRIFSLLEEVEELEEELGRQEDIPAIVADVDGDGARNDVVDHVGRELLVFRDCAPETEDESLGAVEDGDFNELLELLLLGDLDALDDGGTHTIDLGDLTQWDFSPGAGLRAACAGREPVLRLALPLDPAHVALATRDLDGDGRDDLLAYGEADGGRIPVRLFVLR